MAVRVETRQPPGALVRRSPDSETGFRADRTCRVWPAVALAAVVVISAVGYGIAAQFVRTPLVNPDELDYTLAAHALAHGEWMNVRGQGYGFGPVYPLVLAPIVALSGSVESAYPLFKLANALLFALAAVPVFFVARRLLPPWWSVAVAAVSVAIPSSIYASLVMTESAAYLVFSVALLAMILALERPSVARQLAFLGAVGLAYATRAQFAAFVPAFLAAFVLACAIDPRRRLRDALVELWPTLGVLALGFTALVARVLLSAASPQELLGGYGALWRGYDPVAVAKLVVYHLAAWELYLFVVPFVVMPIVVAQLVRDARRGGSREGAFVSVFLAVNAALLLIASAFASTPYGYSELHDRYLFYAAPLWLVVLAVWLSRGLPRPLVWTALGAALALVLPVVLPFGLIGGNVVFEEVPTALWSWVWTVVHATPHVDGSRVVALTALVLTVAAVAVPRRLWPVLPAVVVAGLVFTSVLAWERQHDEPGDFVAADRGAKTWVDEALPKTAKATKLYVSPPECPYTEKVRDAFFLTEFYNNTSFRRAFAIGDSVSDGLSIERAHVGPGGLLRLGDGEPLVARYVVTQPGIVLAGRRIARGTGADLVLWRTHGDVRLSNARLRTEDVLTDACR